MDVQTTSCGLRSSPLDTVNNQPNHFSNHNLLLVFGCRTVVNRWSGWRSHRIRVFPWNLFEQRRIHSECIVLSVRIFPVNVVPATDDIHFCDIGQQTVLQIHGHQTDIDRFADTVPKNYSCTVRDHHFAGNCFGCGVCHRLWIRRTVDVSIPYVVCDYECCVVVHGQKY